MILCIDDDLKGLQVRQMVLENAGYKVLTAGSGREALEHFSAHRISAVILDYAMPDMDGGQVAAELRRLKPDVKILLLSAYVDLPQETFNLIDARVVKGTSPTSFLVTLKHLLSCASMA